MAAVLSPNETVAVIRLSGDISLEDMDSMVQTLAGLTLQNQNRVVLNFKQVTHISLNAISKLAERAQRFRAVGGEIKLVGLIPYVSNLFKLVGAYSRFEVLPDEDDAVSRFES